MLSSATRRRNYCELLLILTMRAIIYTVLVATALFVSTTATPTANADAGRKESLPDLSKIVQKFGRREFPAAGAPTKYFQEPGYVSSLLARHEIIEPN